MDTPGVMQTILKKPYGLNIYKHIFVDLNSIRRIPGIHNNGTRMSDHRAIKFDLYVYDNEREKGHWKLKRHF